MLAGEAVGILHGDGGGLAHEAIEATQRATPRARAFRYIACSQDVPGPPYCAYGLRVPACCVLYVPEAQGSLPLREDYCAYDRVPCGAPQVLLMQPYVMEAATLFTS